MKNKDNDNAILNQKNTTESENENKRDNQRKNVDENIKEISNENEDFSISKRTLRIIKKRNKRRNKIKMNFLYKIGFILFVIAIGFLIAAMVICLVEDAIDHDSFLAILFSIISASLAFLGIILTCISKEKPTKTKN